MCPFEIVYGLVPRAPIDLMPLPNSEKLNFDAKQRAELKNWFALMTLPNSERLNFDAKKRAEMMLKLHEITKENIERMNSKYKVVGDKGRKQLIF
jgi:hypothetical protein